MAQDRACTPRVSGLPAVGNSAPRERLKSPAQRQYRAFRRPGDDLASQRGHRDTASSTRNGDSKKCCWADRFTAVSEERWKQLTEWPLTAAAVVYLGVYAWIVLAQPDGPMARIGDAVLWGTWLAFAGDYAVRWYLARPRWRWFFRHLHELAIVALPMLRPLRLLRLVTMLNVLQRSVGGAFRGRVIAYTAGRLCCWFSSPH